MLGGAHYSIAMLDAAAALSVTSGARGRGVDRGENIALCSGESELSLVRRRAVSRKPPVDASPLFTQTNVAISSPSLQRMLSA